jgi:hypothetical protein
MLTTYILTLVRAIRNYAKNWADFDPIPELNQTDENADLVLLALSLNDVQFEDVVSDPWYPATKKVEQKGLDGSSVGQRYASDEPASFLDCKVQHQWCDPNKSPDAGCTHLSGFTEAATTAQELFKRQSQNASFYATTWTLNLAPSIEVVRDRIGVGALTSRYTLNQGVQGPLPSNQWQLDVEHMHATTLAALQRMIIEQATGPTDPTVQRFFV